MLAVQEFARSEERPSAVVTLAFASRQKSRLSATLDNGASVSIVLEHGRVMRNGDLLRATDGTIIEVRAAREFVSMLRSSDSLLLARGAYHLGNRHVPLQVGDGFLRYQHDHVLDDMARKLGFTVIHEDAPFEPEAGAYGDGHRHADRHQYD